MPFTVTLSSFWISDKKKPQKNRMIDVRRHCTCANVSSPFFIDFWQERLGAMGKALAFYAPFKEEENLIIYSVLRQLRVYSILYITVFYLVDKRKKLWLCGLLKIKRVRRKKIMYALGMHRISGRPDNPAFFISGRIIRPFLKSGIRPYTRLPCRISGWISGKARYRISG
jgi:hypothetical protein